MRECFSCGSRSIETAFPLEPAPRGQPTLCLDCLLEWASEVTRADRVAETARTVRSRIVTRASYRAKRRFREASGQGDLIDRVVRSP